MLALLGWHLIKTHLYLVAIVRAPRGRLEEEAPTIVIRFECSSVEYEVGRAAGG
jgi:hypothetical protein